MSCIKLGYQVKEIITGFEGVVTARCEYLHSNTRIQVTSKTLQDGKPVVEWFDEDSLQIVLC